MAIDYFLTIQSSKHPYFEQQQGNRKQHPKLTITIIATKPILISSSKGRKPTSSLTLETISEVAGASVIIPTSQVYTTPISQG